MKLSEILKQDAEGVYQATEGLFKLVDDLEWKPATGKNWMKTAQLLMHCTNACGMSVKGFVTGEWPMPEGVTPGESPPEAMLPTAEHNTRWFIEAGHRACMPSVAISCSGGGET